MEPLNTKFTQYIIITQYINNTLSDSDLRHSCLHRVQCQRDVQTHSQTQQSSVYCYCYVSAESVAVDPTAWHTVTVQSVPVVLFYLQQ